MCKVNSDFCWDVWRIIEELLKLKSESIPCDWNVWILENSPKWDMISDISAGVCPFPSLSENAWREISTDVSIYFYVFKTGRNRYVVWNETKCPGYLWSGQPWYLFYSCGMSDESLAINVTWIISNRNNRFPKRFQNGENQYFGFIGRRWESLVVILEIKSSTVRFHLTNKPFYRSQPLFTAVNPRSIFWKSFWAPFLSLWSSSPTWIWDFVDLSPFEAIQGPLFCIVWFQGGQKWPHWPKDFK